MCLRKAQFHWLLHSLLLALLCGHPVELHSRTAPKISSVIGNAFLVSKDQPEKEPIKLQPTQIYDVTFPYSFVTSKESFLEISGLSNEYPFTIRLGQSTGLELRDSSNFFLFNGSILLADRGDHSWHIESNSSQIKMGGSGTFIVETTTLGFKLIILEGKFELITEGGKKSLNSGDLALIIGREGRITQGLQIELPLILSTSRLVNFFPEELPTHPRLMSAAQVQVLRMKTKYDAFIGGVSEDRKLRIWKVDPEKEKKNQ